ncbi:hypothetical protein BGZ74_006129 [Mortierella antarctica]|nr:hypothetical protein BGZ74_006129 [Mortierella antarctica]
MAGAGSRFPATYNRLAKWYPHISVQFPVAPQELTRDRAEQERYLADGLIRGSVSLQCLGDMIYQGQKVLTRRWKYFPGPLPTLLLHGTDDPICSYQATALLSSQLLKRNPSNFIFRSWKCNRHDPHWDIDALSVRSEFIQWIRGHCKHFVSLPLEPGMVRYDSLKSIRSNKSANAKSKDKGTKTKEKQSKSKVKDKGKKPAKETTPPPPTNESQSGDKSPTKAKSAATLEPEAIQDLEGLRREQLLRMQKAEEKRREYSQGALESSEGANNTSTTNIQQQPPPPQTIHNKSLGVSLDELTLRLEKEVESGATIPRAISLDQMPRPIDMALSTISLPLALGGIVLDVLTPILASPKVGEKEINESGGSARALPQASIQDTAKVGDEPVTLSSIESLAKREATGDIDAQAQPVITVNDPVVQDVAPTVEQTEQPAVHVEAAKDASPVLETTLSSARTPLEEVEEVVPAMESTPHMGHPPPEQSMIAA